MYNIRGRHRIRDFPHLRFHAEQHCDALRSRISKNRIDAALSLPSRLSQKALCRAYPTQIRLSCFQSPLRKGPISVPMYLLKIHRGLSCSGFFQALPIFCRWAKMPRFLSRKTRNQARARAVRFYRSAKALHTRFRRPNRLFWHTDTRRLRRRKDKARCR